MALELDQAIGLFKLAESEGYVLLEDVEGVAAWYLLMGYNDYRRSFMVIKAVNDAIEYICAQTGRQLGYYTLLWDEQSNTYTYVKDEPG